ncbi:hypothetical protein DFH07DRAFT_776508 [Mycena maculata]|uniref:Uncharacterized protein n=1 Tax=Mycena maculata TaxID=230809 RepID=A0AAD7INM6_9AGAR|nr:hypothetical protein DFH07DRAFT_776508 [Mycena maculata]
MALGRLQALLVQLEGLNLDPQLEEQLAATASAAESQLLQLQATPNASASSSSTAAEGATGAADSQHSPPGLGFAIPYSIKFEIIVLFQSLQSSGSGLTAAINFAIYYISPAITVHINTVEVDLALAKLPSSAGITVARVVTSAPPGTGINAARIKRNSNISFEL